jgi:hypothetical protein
MSTCDALHLSHGASMSTYDALLGIARDLEESRVLSVYLAREERDPGQAGLWRARLDASVAEARSRIEGGNGQELADFDAAAGRVAEAAASFGRVLPSRGWFACATPDGLCHEERLAFSPRMTVRWRRGAFLAPYVRGLKGERPVLVGLVDRRRARLLSYRDGLLEPIRELDADTDILDLSDIGMSKRAATASGVRGETRTDAGKDALDEIAKRLRDRVAEIVVDLAGSDGTVLVGGAKKAAASIMRVLAPKLTGRLMDLSDVPIDADRATLVREVELAASAVTSRRQFELLDQARGTSGLGALGWNDTLSALRGGAVDTLLLSRELIAMAPDDTEDLVRLALAHRADVEELGGDIGTELHESAGGVAARLRFRAIR